MWPRKKKYGPALWKSLPSAKAAERKLIKNAKPKQRVRSISKCQAQRLREYAAAVNSFRASHPDNKVCHVCLVENKKRETRIFNHHLRGRAGALLCNQTFFMSLCFKCHRYVHDNPSWAALRGYLDLEHWNQTKA